MNCSSAIAWWHFASRIGYWAMKPTRSTRCQEAFIKALLHLPSFQGRSSFKTWMLRRG